MGKTLSSNVTVEDRSWKAPSLTKIEFWKYHYYYYCFPEGSSVLFFDFYRVLHIIDIFFTDCCMTWWLAVFQRAAVWCSLTLPSDLLFSEGSGVMLILVVAVFQMAAVCCSLTFTECSKTWWRWTAPRTCSGCTRTWSPCPWTTAQSSPGSSRSLTLTCFLDSSLHTHLTKIKKGPALQILFSKSKDMFKASHA